VIELSTRPATRVFVDDDENAVVSTTSNVDESETELTKSLKSTPPTEMKAFVRTMRAISWSLLLLLV
jgi:hypothetical protein